MACECRPPPARSGIQANTVAESFEKDSAAAARLYAQAAASDEDGR